MLPSSKLISVEISQLAKELRVVGDVGYRDNVFYMRAPAALSKRYAIQ